MTHIHGAAAVVTPHGPLIGDELPDLRVALDKARRSHSGRVVLDLASAPYVDSLGIELLLETCARGGPGHKPRVAALTEPCREALELTDVLGRLDVYDSVENALRSCQR